MKDILIYDESGKNVIGINDITIRSVVIPNGISAIGDKAFMGCNRMLNIEIPNSVTRIGNEAFNGCTHLLDVDVPASVTSIGDNVFVGISGAIIMHSLNPQTIAISDLCFTPRDYNFNILVVPSEAIEDYRLHPVFGKFRNIKKISEFI